MITIDNLKKVLEELHYVAARDKNIYIREFIQIRKIKK